MLCCWGMKEKVYIWAKGATSLVLLQTVTWQMAVNMFVTGKSVNMCALRACVCVGGSCMNMWWQVHLPHTQRREGNWMGEGSCWRRRRAPPPVSKTHAGGSGSTTVPLKNKEGDKKRDRKRRRSAKVTVSAACTGFSLREGESAKHVSETARSLGQISDSIRSV